MFLQVPVCPQEGGQVSVWFHVLSGCLIQYSSCGVFVQGVSVQRGFCQCKLRGGRYASYWKAVMFILISKDKPFKVRNPTFNSVTQL